jgi:hypothetical protein
MFPEPSRACQQAAPINAAGSGVGPIMQSSVPVNGALRAELRLLLRDELRQMLCDPETLRAALFRVPSGPTKSHTCAHVWGTRTRTKPNRVTIWGCLPGPAAQGLQRSQSGQERLPKIRRVCAVLHHRWHAIPNKTVTAGKE